MVSLIGRLCALCAMSVLLQMLLVQEKGREGVRLVCGLLMLRLVFEGGNELLHQLAAGKDLMEMMACLMK